MQAVIEYDNKDIGVVVGLQGFGREIAERVLDDVPREMISAEISPEKPFRVIGTNIDNGLNGFFVRSFATWEEAEEHVASWPDEEFTPSMIVEASRRWGATHPTRATSSSRSGTDGRSPTSWTPPSLRCRWSWPSI